MNLIAANGIQLLAMLFMSGKYVQIGEMWLGGPEFAFSLIHAVNRFYILGVFHMVSTKNR